MLRALALACLLAAPASLAAPKEGSWTKHVLAKQATWASFHTSQGTFVARLYVEDTPATTLNFVQLAAGEREWRDPASNQLTRRPLYPGTVFHRVIAGFMVQGGDPTGTGRGSPGYQFADEIVPRHTFDEKGLLAMANAGPGTNGSQFFVTVSDNLPFLNGRHTIFGEVVSGYDVVERIAQVRTDGQDRPLEPVVLERIELHDKNPARRERRSSSR